MVSLEIRDTGIGMSPEEIARVFDEFAQADGSRTRSHEGAGLGLALCRHFIVSLGGAIELESAPGEGTLVRVRLPLEFRQADA